MDSSYQQNNPSDDNNDPSKNNNNNNNNQSKKSHPKKGKGRQKIPMEKITSETSRQVTFSKRKGGILKKASELHTLCDGENAVILFSPSNKPHSFGAPNIQAVTDRFLNFTGFGRTRPNRTPPAHENAITRQRNLELTNLERQLEEEKRKQKEHERIREANQNQIGYPPNLDLLDFDQLQALKFNLEGLKHALATMMTEAADKGADPGAGSGGPGVGYPMDPNTQGPPSYNMADQFNFGNNGTMPSDMGPIFSDGTLHNYQAQFDFGGNNPPSGGFMNDPRASYFNNNPDSTLYQDMVTNNHDDVDLYNPAVNNYHMYQFPPLPNDHEAGSSNPVFPYNYGCPNDELQNEYRTGGDDAEGEDGDGEGGGAQDPYGGFNNFNNFGRGN